MVKGCICRKIIITLQKNYMTIYETVRHLREHNVADEAIIIMLCEKYNTAIELLEKLLCKELPQLTIPPDKSKK